jgi:hypothetical protein
MCLKGRVFAEHESEGQERDLEREIALRFCPLLSVCVLKHPHEIEMVFVS